MMWTTELNKHAMRCEFIAVKGEDTVKMKHYRLLFEYSNLAARVKEQRTADQKCTILI